MRKITDILLEHLLKTVLLVAVCFFAWEQDMSLPSFLLLVIVVSAIGGLLFGIYEAYKKDK